MKKILLFSLIACLGFVGNSFAEDSCDVKKLRDGTKVCAYTPVGGGFEQEKCLEVSVPSGYGRYNWCAVKKANKYWHEVGHACDPANAPGGTGHCIEQKGEWYENLYCDSKTYHNYATPVSCECKNPEAKEKVKKAGITSCAAKECNNGYLLYTTNLDGQISIVDAVLSSQKSRMTKQSVRSQGLCRSRNKLKAICDKGCGCDSDEKCELNEVVVKNYGKNVAAYVGEEMCVCVPQNGQPNDNEKPNGDEPVVETTPDCDNPCEVRQKISVICPDGRSGLNTDKLLYKICPDDLRKLGLKSSSCPEVQRSFDACRDADCIKNLINDVNLYKELIKAVCETGTGSASGSTGNSSAGGTSASEVLVAQKKLDDFYAYAKGNRSVWKDAEGKFNTTRLASDLTAGVVLGTVGGVVSGVVIKKKQVEKGFDALHCTVGGQTVADWGDTFNVGLR